jgi:general L-amino acid transport system substrate-binding protein
VEGLESRSLGLVPGIKAMRLFPIFLSLLVVACSALPAHAGSVAKRVKTRRVLRCGSVARPGLAEPAGDRKWSGLEVDLCRAVAVAVLGNTASIDFHGYRTWKDFDAVRRGRDDLFFLTGSEIAEQKLAGKVVPGPTVFVDSLATMVPAASLVRHLQELKGKSICFKIGDPVERSLNAYFGEHRIGWLRRGFSEYSEMNDAYNAGAASPLPARRPPWPRSDSKRA